MQLFSELKFELKSKSALSPQMQSISKIRQINLKINDICIKKQTPLIKTGSAGIYITL